MLISERQQKILSLLRDYPDYTVAQLASALFVSEPTIRRDFTELESKGFITKFYGGARVNQEHLGEAGSKANLSIMEPEEAEKFGHSCSAHSKVSQS